MRVPNSLGYIFSHLSLRFPLFFYNSNFLQQIKLVFVIKSLQSDNTKEFLSLIKMLRSFGITHRLTCPHTQQQNDSIERKHRHIVETGLALLFASSLPLTFWVEALVLLFISSTCYLPLF